MAKGIIKRIIGGVDTSVLTAGTFDVLAGETFIGNGSDEPLVGKLGTQSKTATPSSSLQTISPDIGNLLSSVTVNPISSRANSYVTGQTTDWNFTDNSHSAVVTVNDYVYWLVVATGDASRRSSPSITVRRDNATIAPVATVNTDEPGGYRLSLYRIMTRVNSFMVIVTNTATDPNQNTSIPYAQIAVIK